MEVQQATIERFKADQAYLTQTDRLALGERAQPIIVIGMPRSGSTFLTHVMNCLDDVFVFDDLYCLQKARSLGCKGTLTGEQIDKLVHFLGWQARARIKHNTHFEKWPMTWEHVDTLCETLRTVLRDEPGDWFDAMDEYLTRIAGYLGRHRWGYKTPQDFYHIEEIKNRRPETRFIFVMRDPRDMMASYKFNRSEDGSAGQYHPWVYARYWRTAITQAAAACERLGINLHMVRLEELKKDANRVAADLAAFLGTAIAHPISKSKPNTSFGKGDRKTITPTETWICQRICGAIMPEYGYEIHDASCRVTDLPDLVATSLRFAAHQSRRALTDPVARVKIRSFCGRALLGRKR